jgi:hypothetical protein
VLTDSANYPNPEKQRGHRHFYVQMTSRSELSRLRLVGDFIGLTLLQARRLAFMKVKMWRRPFFGLVEPTALSLELS